ncbi:MAG: hypothetical protein U0234_19035 [Sandaracinus sp.]
MGNRFAAVTALVVVSLCASCTYSRYAAPHQPYTPLLDHEGQMDVAASAGTMEQMRSTVSARVAYSPVRYLSIMGGYDGDFLRTTDDNTEHHAGSLGLGTYVHARILRIEAALVVGVGAASGDGYSSYLSGTGGGSSYYQLDGIYVQPAAQFAIGFEVPYFEFAGGVRLGGSFGDVRWASSASTTGTVPHDTLLFDHFITVRIPIDVFRFEVTGGWAGMFYGDNAPVGAETPSRAYVTAGIGFQFDTMDVEPYADDPNAPAQLAPREPTSGGAVYVAPPPPPAEPMPVLVPPSTPPPPTEVVVPAPPGAYETPPPSP